MTHDEIKLSIGHGFAIILTNPSLSATAQHPQQLALKVRLFCKI